MNSKDAFVLFVNQNPCYSYLDVWNAGEKFGANKQQSHKPFSSVVDENKLNHAMYDDDLFFKDVIHIAKLTGIFVPHNGINVCTTVDINKLYSFAHEFMKLRTSRIFDVVYGEAAQGSNPVG